MSNTSQKDRRRAQPDRQPGEIAVPEQVIVSMAGIAESAKEGLLALAVGTGLQVMAAMFAEDAARLCGPEGKHNPGRAGYRHGSVGSLWFRCPGAGRQYVGRPASGPSGSRFRRSRGAYAAEGRCLGADEHLKRPAGSPPGMSSSPVR